MSLRSSFVCERRGPQAALAIAVSLVFLGGCSAEDPSTGQPAQSAPLIRPAKDEVITIGTQQPIEWTPLAGVDSVDITVTSPDGKIQTIAEAAANQGSYQWKVPLLYTADPKKGYTISVKPSGQISANPTDPVKPTLGVQDSLTVGSLAGFKWNGMTEDYYWVDLLTGQSQVIGTVGDMKWWEWKGGAAFDLTGGLVYVIASPEDAETIWKVYTLDPSSGALLNDVEIQGTHPSAIKVNSAGEILGMSWNGSKEEISSVDPTTGAVTVRGTVGNLSLWQVESAIDNVNNRLYVIGEEDPDFDPQMGSGPNAAWSVYTIDSLTGAVLDTKPLTKPYIDLSGLATTNAGELVAFRWNGNAEELVGIDPTTGTITPRGTVGDLTLWSGYTALNLSTDDIYVFGMDPNNKNTLYAINATSGALLYELPVTDYPTTALLVY